MGFYVRKSIRVGPFRFNLSGSGIGVSAGIKGLRVGTGPRGNYVHMGRGGLYFRKTLPGDRPPIKSPEAPIRRLTPLTAEPPEMTAIESGQVSAMVDSTSAELLAELNAKRKMMNRWPLIVICGLSLSGILTLAGAPTRGLIIALVACGLGVVFYVLDDLRKTTVIFYDLGPEAMAAFQRFLDAFNALASAGGVWHVSASGGVRDRKYHAGASTLVERARIQPSRGAPPFVKTNIDVPTIRVGSQLLAFLPDRVLVFDSGAVGAVGYPDLTLEINQTRFIEEGTVPTDTKTVDTTWRYVNKKGGPDKRFKNNRQLPIVLYEEMLLLSPTGLREMLQISRTGIAELLAEAAKGLAKEATAVGARPNSPADGNDPRRNDLADAGLTRRT